MILYITSSPCIDGADRAILNPQNGFLARLKADLPPCPRCLFIASSPDDHELSCHFGSHMFMAFAEAGIPFSAYRVLDSENSHEAEDLIADSDLIILAGGHVPTQNRFFNDIQLGELLEDYEGVVMGISAGSMNCAERVYAQPELPGETLDPDYRRWLPGLGLTRVNVLPHYQKVKDDIIDGQRLFEDVTYYDSYGHTFFALPDGSYFYCHEGETLLLGEAYRLRNGILELISLDDEIHHFSKIE